MIIRAGIHKAKKEYHCFNCRKRIKIGELYMRLYGCAEPGDPLYEITEHTECTFPILMKGDDYIKMIKAFEKRGIKLKIEKNWVTGILEELT